MKTEWENIKNIVHSTMEQSPEQRDRFVSEACSGNQELLKEVYALLDSIKNADSFMEDGAIVKVADVSTGEEPRLPSGSLLSHYKIVRLLGEGGMGAVYLAKDLKLRRHVAIKILPETIAANENLQRFEQEAFAASALNHPNILTIYEIGEEEGLHFIVSEYVAGEILRDRIKSLTINETLDISIQVAGALEAAHKSGIVHRDLKPENMILREDGVVKVVDFGLAKITQQTPKVDTEDETWAHVRTKTGTVMGTASYMSPEQARGKNIDEKTDIWSLGVVIYEMLTRKTPFNGDTQFDVIASILRSDPQPVESHGEPIPPELIHIVKKALRKDKESRYQTMKDVLADLREVKDGIAFSEKLERTTFPNDGKKTSDERTETFDTSALLIPARRDVSLADRRRRQLTFGLLAAVVILSTVGFVYWFWIIPPNTQIESIAVLPFQNKSSEPDTDYLSDGLAESLIYRLSQLPDLKVSPTSTVFRYKGSETDPLKIGQELGVNAVLSGRIVQRGDSITISAELVDVRYEKLLWGEQYDRTTADLLATQREIARQIVDTLKLKVSPNDGELTKHYTENNEAYQLYLKGRFYWNKRNPEALMKAIEYFNQAIEKDSGFALAYAGLADCYVVPANGMSPQEAMPKAKAAALRAIEIDETLAEAHTSLGRILQAYDWNWVGAEKEFRRAIELNPHYAVAHQWYGGYFERIGRSKEAISERKIALELDPLSPIINFELAQAYYFARDYDLAIAQFQKTLDLDPTFPPALLNLPAVYLQKGLYDEAIEGFKAAPDIGSFTSKGSLGNAYAVAGRKVEALEVLNDLKRRSGRQYTSAISLALIYAGLGEKDEAFAWLEKAYEGREFQIQWLMVDPRWDSLRSDPRFADLLHRVGLSS